MRNKIRQGRTFAILDTVESLLRRAKKAEETPEDYSWPEIMYYRGVIDRHDDGKRRGLNQTESMFLASYERGYAAMDKTMLEEFHETKKT